MGDLYLVLVILEDHLALLVELVCVREIDSLEEHEQPPSRCDTTIDTQYSGSGFKNACRVFCVCIASQAVSVEKVLHGSSEV